MRCDMPDAQFLEFVDLNHPSMARARELAAKGRTRQAAREAARAMFAEPFRHPVREQEIPALAGIIRKRRGDQVAWLRRLADDYLLAKAARPGRNGAGHEEEHALYRVPERNWVRRGENVHALGRLYRLTGERKYSAAAVAEIRRFMETMEPLADGEQAGAFVWHPHSSHPTHDIGHLPEKLCHALPYLRANLKTDDALMLAKGLLAMADFCYRTCRYDVPHNITLHMLTGSLLVGLLFPALKPARRWVSWVQKRVEQDFTSTAFVTADGYFGEGFSYQAVNHNLMLVCLRYLLAAGRKVSPKLRQACQKSFEFAAAITRNDGKCPEFGDSHSQLVHEHHISHHEMLHLAAAVFGRDDFKAAAGTAYGEEPLEYNLWLMGLEGIAWWDAAKAAPRASRLARPYDLRASGFQFFGLGRGLAAHSGMFACAATHNHAHMDFGSIDISGFGRPLLTDTGVTSYGEDSYRDDRAHNLTAPIRRKPLGPRLDRADHQRTLFVIHRGDLQAACMEHDLYESFRIRRTVCLVNAAETLRLGPAGGDDLPAFWVVVDRVDRREPWAGATQPHDYIETSFHFNAPQTRLGCEAATLTCWSRHEPAGLELRRYAPTDVAFEGRAQRVPYAEHCRAYEYSSSDANLQVTALQPAGSHSIMDMRFFEGFTGEYGGRVKRPSMAYRWQGHVPFTAAYVLVPFRGLRSTPYAKVEGGWSRGDLSLTVHLPQGIVGMAVKGLQAAAPKPRFALKQVPRRL